MNQLLRELAPISDDAWAELEDQARRTLKPQLIARALVDFRGPLGWQASAVNLGRVRSLNGNFVEGVHTSMREVLPLVEVRTEFELSLRELENIARGDRGADLDPLIEAAKRIGLAEDTAVFHGYPEAQIQGISQASTHRPMSIAEDYEQFPGMVAEAIGSLQQWGVSGPYAIALGPRCYAGVMTAGGRSGYPIIERLRQVVDGPIVFAPAVDGSLVLSQRGGDFELTVGQDISLGYVGHDGDRVRLYLVESFTFQVFGPEAAVHLSYTA